MNNTSVFFNLYRYQLLPKDRFFQGTLFGEINSVEELIEQKNKLFQQQLKTITEWRGHKSTSKINATLVYEKDDFLLFKFAPKKKAMLENESFQHENHDNWPSILVAIWNDKDKQYIVIQDRKQAFASTKSVEKVIAKSVNDSLFNYQLKIYLEPRFNKKTFWSIVTDKRELVKNLKFELITPNMSNISGVLSDDLKRLAKGTNSAKLDISINSHDDAILENINQDNPDVSSLVNYASEGGGNISIKLKGVKKRIQTESSIESIEIDEVSVIGNNYVEMLKLIKSSILGVEDREE